MSNTDVRIVVCVSCREAGDPEAKPGAKFLETLRERLAQRGLSIQAEPVECLAVCKRPATVALAAPGKWTYVLGDIRLETGVDELIDSALRFAESANGVVAWKDRPACFRKGVVSRTPPLP